MTGASPVTTIHVEAVKTAYSSDRACHVMPKLAITIWKEKENFDNK